VTNLLRHYLLISAGCANAVAVLGGLLLAVPDWARLSIRASVLPVVSRTVLMPDRQQCLQAVMNRHDPLEMRCPLFPRKQM
jgi:hypothetical protein